MAQLNTAAGDGELRVSVGNTGSFSGANYDPIGAIGSSSTTYESDVAFRIGNSGARQYLSGIATNVTTQSSSDPNSVASIFTVSGLRFNLLQTVRDLTKNGQRTGSGLVQSYQITNPTNAPISFELVRYFDGDLQFDGTLADRGGRILRNGRDILFETDSGDNPSAPTTFVGITANGGTPLTSNRFEIGQFSALRGRILAGENLANKIQGDTNGDSFIDSAPYDVTPAFRNTFVLAPGATTVYTTETLFGSGIPSQVSLPDTITVAATTPNAIEDTGTPGVFTFTRANSNLNRELTVSYTMSGKATSGVDYQELSGSVTFAVGQDKATVNLAPIADNLPEGIESVILTINEGIGYNLNDRSRQARVAISDNSSILDILPKASIDGSPTIIESNSGTKTAVFNVTLDKPSEVEVTVDVSTADGTATTAGKDYNALKNATLYFAPGETRQQIAVDIIGDRDLEADETFTVNLVDPTNVELSNNRSITETIVDTDTPLTLTVADANAAETRAGETPDPAQFVLTRGGDLSKPFTVKYQLAGTNKNGLDYDNLGGTAVFAAGVDRVALDINPIDDSIFEGDRTVILSVSTDDYVVTGSNSITATIADNGDSATPSLAEAANKLLLLKGGPDHTSLKFTKSSQAGSDRGEVAVYTVDDDLGSINGIKPGESGYLAAAIGRAQTIFSSLGNSDFDKQWNSSQRAVDVRQDQRFGFLKIDNDSLDGTKFNLQAGQQPSNISISIPTANASTPFGLTSTNNGYKVDFNNLVLNVEPIANYERPKGSELQGKSGGEVIDLRAMTQANVDMKVAGDCVYSNYIGFYEVEDQNGTLANGLKPGDAGYAKAAIEGAILKSQYKSQDNRTLSVSGGKILAPVVIANGTFDDLLKQNPTNKADSNIHAYFNYIGANTDKVDHFRLLGDNKFGVEDMYGGGDRDYNDVTIQLKVS